MQKRLVKTLSILLEALAFLQWWIYKNGYIGSYQSLFHFHYFGVLKSVFCTVLFAFSFHNSQNFVLCTARYLFSVETTLQLWLLVHISSQIICKFLNEIIGNICLFLNSAPQPSVLPFHEVLNKYLDEYQPLVFSRVCYYSVSKFINMGKL